MPVIRVDMFAGRSDDEKKALAKGLTEAYVQACGGKPQSVWVLFEDRVKSNWAIGGELCSGLFPDVPKTAAE
nr:tautomerase family protein [uncultured Gellertiella sp.]